MYTLRIIEEVRKNENTPFSQVIRNFNLGDSYSTYTKGSEKFNEIVSNLPKDNEIRKIVIDSKQLEYTIFSCSKNTKFSYFIMTENGKTFERL